MVIMSYAIWIDENIDSEENIEYSKELDSLGLFNFRAFKQINEAINYMKKIQFEETKVIINGRLYAKFVEIFKENILDLCVAPKIIIFTRNKKTFMEYNKEFITNNLFYTFGGVVTTFKEVKKFIKKQNESKNEESQFTFDYIDSIEKLALPMFFKTLIDNASIDNMEEYNISLYDRYSKNDDRIKSLLGSIKSMTNIPIEILSKYYARLLTANSDFYKDVNKDLRLNKKDPYLSLIKTLYEGVKLNSLPLASDKILYRGSLISNEELEKIKNNLNKKVENLPSSIAFSKTFLSFSKEREIAELFFKNCKKSKIFSKVMYIIEKDDNIGFNLSTHGDIESISYFPNEKEVLFFPFSSFEVKGVKEINIGKEKGYEIKLLYLGKYLKEIENDENVIKKGKEIPECEFKRQLEEFGLIRPERIKNLNTKTLYDDYQRYEEEIEENNKKNRIKKNIKNNIIIGEINISQNDINKDIQIINSFENYKKINQLNDKDDDWKQKNEEEIKENIEIKINGEKTEFSYLYKFKKKGLHRIEYLFKKLMRNTSCMFYDCKSLTNINLSNFKSQLIRNMSYMFCYCKSLTNLDLSNINTQKVNNMNYMFHCCESLTNLDISSFNTQNVTNMEGMFHGCESLTDLDLSSFNTQSATNMEGMFYYCKNLTDLNLSNFNTQNVTNMNEMFYYCASLTELNLSNFNTQNVTNMNRMFYECGSLTVLNISNFNTQNVIDMGGMFHGCESITNLDLSNFNTQNVTNMYEMFLKCKSLIKLNLLNFNTQNVTNMSHMFESCKSLKKQNIITEDENILNVIDNLYHKKSNI